MVKQQDSPPARFWNSLSLNARLVLLVTVMMAWGLTLSGVTVIGILQNHLIGQIDAELTASARRIADYSVQSLLENTKPILPSNYYLRVEIDGNQPISIIGDSLRDSAGVPEPTQLLTPGTIPDQGVTQPVTIQSSIAGRSWRAVAVPLVHTGTTKPAGVVTIALPLFGVSRTVNNTALYVLISSLALITVGAVISSRLVRRSLRPLLRIEKVAHQIADGDLSRRIDNPTPDTEVGSLARSLNTMLAHIETAFAAQEASEAKMRRFISDASHELRTPLSAVRGYGELYRMGGVPPERVPEVMERIESEARRMGTLVESLLTLARLDEGRQPRFSQVDLLTLAKGAEMDCRALDPERPVKLIPLPPATQLESLTVCADRDQITQVFTNIIGNIVRYTPRASAVEIAVGRSSDDHARIEFRDHGAGIPDDEKPRVFQRFYRADKSRSREFGGSGLGLAIVQAIITAHQGAVDLCDTPGGGLTVAITLPFTLTTDEGVCGANNE